MKIEVRHRFDCTPERYWEMYWHPEFDQMLNKRSTVTREVVDENDDGTVLYRRLRFTPDRELPRAASRILGSTKLVYEQDNYLDRARGVMTWEVLPSVLPGKVNAKGSFAVSAVPGGCELAVVGEVQVKLRFIGGMVEQTIVDSVKQSYEMMAEISREWLVKHG